jgi:hypothetical protein
MQGKGESLVPVAQELTLKEENVPPKPTAYRLVPTSYSPMSTEPLIHTPEDIASRVGNITVKTLSALIRSRGLETTTLGYAPPSRKGGPRRRVWGMTDAQLQSLLAVRKIHS